MRFRDAAHVDLGSFYARLPALGRLYRLVGYAACVGALWWADDVHRIGTLMVVVLIAWGMAWRREVGALWRAPLVAALALCAVIITADRLGHPLHPRAVAAAPAAAEGPTNERRIEFRYGPDGAFTPMPSAGQEKSP
jgi:hypothetical protein